MRTALGRLGERGDRSTLELECRIQCQVFKAIFAGVVPSYSYGVGRNYTTFEKKEAGREMSSGTHP